MVGIATALCNNFLGFSLIAIALLSLFGAFFKRISAINALKNIFFITITTLATIVFTVSFIYYSFNITHTTLLVAFFVIIALHLFHSSGKLSGPSVIFLVVSAFAGTFFAGKSQDFISTYLAFEAISFCGYIMVAILNKKPMASESSIKYFVIGGVSSAIMLFGISFIYGVGGSFNFTSIYNHPLTNLGLILFLCGIFFKLTAFPVHFWAPDVYSTTTLSTLGVIATLPKIAALLVLSSIMPYVENPIIFIVITIVCIASMLVGSIGGIFQTSTNKILAYSGIANMGFILSVYTIKPFNQLVLVEFISIYAISTLFVILLLFTIEHKIGSISSLKDFKGLHKKHPALAFITSLSLLNIAGIPPLAGFYAKFIILKHLIASDNLYLPFIIVATSAIGLFYYLKIIKNIYLEEPQQQDECNIKTNFILKVLIVTISFWALTYFLFEGSFVYKILIENSVF